MKKICVICFLITIILSHAQTVVDMFGGLSFAKNEIWLDKPITDSSKFEFFGYSSYKINYNNQALNNFFYYATLSYEIGKGFGIATGGYTSTEGFLPILALNYCYESKNWFIDLFPSIEIRKKPNAEMFAIIQFRPKINNNVRLFSQMIANCSFNNKQFFYFEQNLRFGIDVQNFQFGLGVNLTQIPVNDSNLSKLTLENHIGLFLRKEF